MRLAAVAAETELARTGIASAESRSLSRGGDPYKQREFAAVTDAHAKDTHVYDVEERSRACCEAAWRGADAGRGLTYESANVTLSAEARDHRRRRSGTKPYRATPCGVEDCVARGTAAVRERGGVEALYLDLDGFSAVAVTLTEAASKNNKNSRADLGWNGGNI